MSFDEFGVEEVEKPKQSIGFNSTEHLWDELEQRSWARPSRPTSVPDLYRMNGLQFPQKHSKILWKAFQKAWMLLELGGEKANSTQKELPD